MEIRKIHTGELITPYLRTFHYTETHADDPDAAYQQTFTTNTDPKAQPGLFQRDDGGFLTLFTYAIETDQPLSLHVVLGTMEITLEELF